MTRTYSSYESRFFCTKCGQEGIPIQRKKGQERKGGHLKKLYCLNCKEETNHVEIKDSSDYDLDSFKREYELGRFIDGQRLETKDLLLCSCENCLYNIDGRCWNSNNSYDCGHKPIKEVL